MKNIYFLKENHKYIDDKNNIYTSVSHLWKPYFGKFDDINIAIKLAYRDLDPTSYKLISSDLNINDKEIVKKLKKISKISQTRINKKTKEYLQKWENKRNLGTAFHKKQELFDINNDYDINPFTKKKQKLINWEIKEGYDNQSFPGNLYQDIPDGYIPEHLIKIDEYKIAGQMDKNFIETINGKRYIDIDDWKTDAEIKIKPGFNFRQKYMNFPINHIYDTNYWRYTLKISTYAYILEQEGFTVRNLAFTHVIIDENLNIIKQKKYRIPYKRMEVQQILKFFKKN